MDLDIDGPAEKDSGLFGLSVSPDDARVVILPVPFDAATSWGRGTSRGPRAVLEASHQIDLYDRFLGTPYEVGIAYLPESAQIHAWNQKSRALADRSRAADAPARPSILSELNTVTSELHTLVQQTVTHWLEHGRVVGTLGGDHSVAFGAIAAHLKRHPNLAVLQIDAHADLRREFEGLAWSHASVMRNVLERTALTRLVQVAVRDVSPGEVAFAEQARPRVLTHFDHDLNSRLFAGLPLLTLWSEIVTDLPAEVYVSLDIDGLDPSLCPHTGTPVPGGLSFAAVTALLDTISQSGRRVVGFDLTEISPGPGDFARSWDATVGAQLLYRLCGHCVYDRRPP